MIIRKRIDNKINRKAIIGKHVKMGTNNEVFPFSVIGQEPQMYDENLKNRKFVQSQNRLIIGDDNIFREFTTVHFPNEGLTRIGNRNLFMAYSHIGHDTIIEDDNKITNNVQIAGYCRIGVGNYFGLSSTVQQRSVIGSHILIAMNSSANGQIPPFSLVEGNPGKICNVNAKKLRLIGATNEEIRLLKYHVLSEKKHYTPEVKNKRVIIAWEEYQNSLK
jgi:UDP-N-acetylglucosamine acyltransferase